ncbi:MAG: response regulator transcription factor [Chloroflexi bacterium]|nr:response regulator transcription factor [Chloroflexota bacterium]
MTIRIVIADDHLFYREGVRALLSSVDEIEIVGEAGNGEEAVRLTGQLYPDVILMDLKMPGMNGIQATHEIVKSNPQAGILIVTMFDDDDSVFAMMRAGARGYILKDADQEELLRAIQSVFRGEAIFSPTIARRMANYFANPPKPAPVPAAAPGETFPDLTERELEILELIAQGQNNSAIANRLSLSLKTVQNYVSNILNKLQAADRVEAMLRAREAGWGKKEA